ncbi:MAG: c-type cytochrome [Thiohalorhabdus sp.]|uniref:c-type cytochrome n=1 Tax=Thiohalorhabdus sp. TaxID=3094134 RepID=UPI00397F997B
MAKSYAGKALTGLGLLTLPWGVLASDLGETIAQEGNDQGAQACVSCHGADGSGNASSGFPRLAGLDASYLAKQLGDFQSDARNEPVMNPIAQGLSAEEIEAVAEYYGDMPAPESADSGTDASEEQLAGGEAIAERGLWDKGVPACTSCHGPDGQGVGDAFPAIAGQHAGYITSQIEAWQSGKRSNDPNRLMAEVAERMTEEEAEAAAAYFASLPAPGSQE